MGFIEGVIGKKEYERLDRVVFGSQKKFSVLESFFLQTLGVRQFDDPTQAQLLGLTSLLVSGVLVGA